ncbi:MAG: hypothetical protein QOF19_622 [Alphaproteobacteria bacterium]|jgi:hypothetical protein|nr:hypothetical protein [Alphaproteobacteria bacterium]
MTAANKIATVTENDWIGVISPYPRWLQFWLMP